MTGIFLTVILSASSWVFSANAQAAEVPVRFELIDGFGHRSSVCQDALHPISGRKMKAKARETNVRFKNGKEYFLQEVNYGVICDDVDYMDERSELHSWLEEMVKTPFDIILTTDDQEPTLIRAYRRAP